MSGDGEHEAYALSRSKDYVYVPSNGAYFNMLDQHAESTEGDVKLPYVVLGSPGSGKSALLANWVQRRKLTKHRDEFLFQHYVGSSPKSKTLFNLLSRLESQIRIQFNLRDMEVPTSENRLRWALKRFLSSAAKKMYPVRIVIVLDGVDKLTGETAAADTMHWMPSELPPGVRFILSTDEYDKYEPASAVPSDDSGPRLHRTWTELKRRGCPFLRVEPLTMDVRHSIIEAFTTKYRRDENDIVRGLEIEEDQIFKLATAKAASQPMFLRTILYVLRLHVEINRDITVDSQIDAYLSAETPGDLIKVVFDLCNSFIEYGDESSQNILGRVLSVLYASRHGLSEIEIWGAVEMAMGSQLEPRTKDIILRILDDLTMTVEGLRMFSHNDYMTAVYQKYIQTPELNIRLHMLMARYFGRLDPCDRKLESLPYHLEVSGSWSKLKGCLVAVDMFKLWWTPKHKSEFIQLWASLTNENNPRVPIRRFVTGEFTPMVNCKQAKRPCYDMVDEFVKSCDDYKYQAQPTHEELAEVLLKVADFLLEFATLGLEKPADVPDFIHPQIPREDLEALGVPYLDEEKDGTSTLKIPLVEGKTGDGRANTEAPAKANEEIPECSTWFFHRWMWIQWPAIALSNCGSHFQKGIESRKARENLGKTVEKQTKARAKKGPNLRSIGANDTISASTLPSIGVNMREYISKTHVMPVKPGEEEVNEDFIEQQYADSEKKVRFEIEERHREYDYYKQQRIALERALQRLRDESSDLEKMHFGSAQLEASRDDILDRCQKADDGTKRERGLNANFMMISNMCERHPAHAGALIDELEQKLAVDEQFIDLVRAKLRVQVFDGHMYHQNEEDMKRQIEEKSLHEHELLTHRHKQRRNFRKYMENEVDRPTSESLQAEMKALAFRKPRTKKGSTKSRSSTSVNSINEAALVEKWAAWQAIIHRRTGISDPDAFFKRFTNSADLFKDMTSMKLERDRLKEQNNKAVAKAERDLDNARLEAQAASMHSGEKKKTETRVNSMLRNQIQLKERADKTEKLAQTAVSGLKHICQTLGIPAVDEDTPIQDIIQQIEALLDTLLEEKDRVLQKAATNAGQSSTRRETPKVRYTFFSNLFFLFIILFKRYFLTVFHRTRHCAHLNLLLLWSSTKLPKISWRAGYTGGWWMRRRIPSRMISR